MKRLIITLLACFVLFGCVKQDDISTLDDRVWQQKERLDKIEQQLENQSAGGGAVTGTDVASIRQDLAQAKSEIEMLQRDMQAFKAAQDQDALVREDVEDLKVAWQRLNSEMGTDINLKDVHAQRLHLPESFADANTNATADDANGSTTTDNGNVVPDMMAVPSATPPSTQAQAAPAAPTAAAPAAPAMTSLDADAAQILYKSARASFEAHEYKKGVALYEEFLTTFKDHKLVPNALFWQGECYYQMKDYARSVLKYQAVIDNYKKSPKYPTSMLKQGIAFNRLGKPRMGRMLLEEVVAKFPKTAEGKRAAAILKK